MPDISNGAHPEIEPNPLPLPEVKLHKDGSPRRKPELKIQSSALAAAIVNSAPLYRRQVFLQPSHSFDQSSWCSTQDPNPKRRSWHVERVTARMLSVLEETGSSLAALPAAFNRSFSTESNSASE